MSRFRFDFVVFLAGLAAVCWIGFGYLGSNPLALAVTLLIGACYLAGALELRRYRQATATLERAVAELAAPPAALGPWLEQLAPGLRGAVRLRVEGERAALPGPALTPYLVGLLVLLGMLGTLLGMVATLKGTGAALDGSTDLLAIRASLAAPVKGLGFAFGTSIAGVATSAMLGLLSALCRRERIEAAQQLDAKIATTLRVFSHAHQREASFALMQRQAEAMPVLVERLQAMMQAIEQRSLALDERQIASQQAFFGKAEAAYTGLAVSVARSLKESAEESGRAAGAAIQPVVEATLANLRSETATLHDTVTQAVQRQLDGLTRGLEATTAAVATVWHDALAEHRRSNEALAGGLRTSLDRFAETFEQRSAGLLESVSTRLETTASTVSQTWNAALVQQAQVSEQMAAGHQQALGAAAATFEAHAADMLRATNESHADLQTRLAAQDQQRLDAWRETVAGMTSTLREQWAEALAQTTERQQAICATLERTASEVAASSAAQARETIAAASTFGQHAADLLRATNESHADLQTRLAAQDQQRLDAWRETVAGMTSTLHEQWAEALAQTTERQQAICATLEHTASEVAASTESHARATIAEMARLVQAASEAPRAAAEVVAELRQKLSDSMVRDTAMLEERSRLLATLETLLNAVSHASTEQRAAIEALVATSADLLERVGTRFTDRVETETRKLDGIAAQVASGAVEVASLGEAFGAAVQSFGASNETLVTHLQRVEAALDKSLARSDEQLAYYVAQAREVIDLSLLSQKQIVEELQQLAGQGAAGVDAA